MTSQRRKDDAIIFAVQKGENPSAKRIAGLKRNDAKKQEYSLEIDWQVSG